MPRPRHLAAAVLAAGGLLLSACGVRPGVAAEVGGSTITRDALQSYVDGQCALVAAQVAQQPGQGGVARSVATRSVLGALVLARQETAYARSHGVIIDRSVLDEQMSKVRANGRELRLSEREQAAYVESTAQLLRGQLVAIAVGADRLAQPLATTGAEQAAKVGATVIDRWVRRSGPQVRVDPRFGLAADGRRLVERDPSVSEAVSTTARQAAAQQPDQEFVVSLPVTQRCG